MTEKERTAPPQPRLELVPTRRDHPRPPHHPAWAVWLSFVSEAAVEYVGLLGAALARMRELGRTPPR